MRRRNRRELGEGQAGCIFAVILLLIGVFVAYKLIPVKVKAAELRQTVVDEAKQAGTHNDEEIRKNILETAAEQGLPVTNKDIRIERKANTIYVEVEYTVPVQFPGYVHNWKFRHKAENPIF